MFRKSLFEELFDENFARDFRSEIRLNSNLIYDVKETELELAYSVLGFGPEEVSVETIENKLRIKATKSDDDTLSNKLVRNIDDTIVINKDYDLEKAECTIKNGVLLITIPKKSEAIAKKLSIKLLK